MGQVAFNAARARDVPLILGATLLGAVAVILGNLVADVLYAVVDPRARKPSGDARHGSTLAQPL